MRSLHSQERHWGGQVSEYSTLQTDESADHIAALWEQGTGITRRPVLKRATASMDLRTIFESPVTGSNTQIGHPSVLDAAGHGSHEEEEELGGSAPLPALSESPSSSLRRRGAVLHRKNPLFYRDVPPRRTDTFQNQKSLLEDFDLQSLPNDFEPSQDALLDSQDEWLVQYVSESETDAIFDRPTAMWTNM